MEKEYVAIIIDVLKSRWMLSDDRFKVQKDLAKGIEDANNYLCGKYGGEDRDFFVPFDFSGGDSVIGLCYKVEDVATTIHLILGDILYDAGVRIALGRGEWTTKLDNHGINAQDGPAFWHARTAMTGAKERGVFFSVADECGDGGCDVFPDEKFEIGKGFIEYVADELDWEEFTAMTNAKFALKTAEEIFQAHCKKF